MMDRPSKCRHVYTEGTGDGTVSCLDCHTLLWVPQEQPCETCRLFAPMANRIMGRCTKLNRTFLRHHYHMLRVGDTPCWEGK